MKYKISFFLGGVFKYTSIVTQLLYVKYHLIQSCLRTKTEILKLKSLISLIKNFSNLLQEEGGFYDDDVSTEPKY